MGFAATKLRSPAPPEGLVRRPLLDAVLDAGVDRHTRLILASAPAGSGKSTLLSSWLSTRNEAAVWLQVEESDSDPARYWSFLVDAIGTVRPSAADTLRPVVSGSHGDELVVVPALVNVLADLETPVIIVVDDYHLIDHANIHRGMERLIDLCPEHVTIVIATRVDPPFRLGRLRVRKKVCEIRAADLRFDASDAIGLLGDSGRVLDSADLNRLCERTEGWAAGLVLAGLSLGRADDPHGFIEAFDGADELVVDYLSDELLDGMDDEDRQRLLETSILEQLSGALIDAVTATVGGATWLLDTAGHNQLLIRLDRFGVWFRYHHLLRDLLRLEAERVIPDRLAELHARAAAWFEAQGDLHPAITHRLAAGDPQTAARLMRDYGVVLLRSGQIATLGALLASLGEVKKTTAACAYLQGWCEYIAGNYSLAQEWLDLTLELVPPSFDRVQTTALQVNIALARGDLAAALRIAREMTAANQFATHHSDLPNACGAAFAWAGLSTDARRALTMAFEMATAEPSWTGQVLALVYTSIVEFDDGPPTSANQAAIRALDKARELGLSEYHGVAPAYAIRSRTDTDSVAAHRHALHAVNLARRSSTPLWLGYVLALCGDELLDLGDKSGAALLVEARSVLDRCADAGIAEAYLTRAESRHRVASPGRERTGVLVEPLTDRELAVLRYLPSQLSLRDVASEVYVSLNTVKTHTSAIYRKLGVRDRKSAVQRARDLRIL